MIIWGGWGPLNRLNDGGRYNPAANSWTAVKTIGAPAPREAHTAVWTGSEMIIWGGSATSYFNDGGRYNPTADNWAATTTSGAPEGRYFHEAVWTGNEMIVWSGIKIASPRPNDGGRYNPQANSWSAMAVGPVGRDAHTMVWTGREMLLWGGFTGSSFLNDTWSYTPGKLMFLYQKR
jgi:N-acetylneuraminic acid mutarotase